MTRHDRASQAQAIPRQTWQALEHLIGRLALRSGRVPPRPPAPSAETLRASALATVELALSRGGAPPEVRTHARTLFSHVSSGMFDVASDAVQAAGMFSQYLGWSLAQQDYNFRLLSGIVDSFITSVQRELPQRKKEILAEKGPVLFELHLLLATRPIGPTAVLFPAGAGYSLVRESFETLGPVLRYSARPSPQREAELGLDLLRSLIALLPFALGTQDEGIQAARVLGRQLADAFADSLIEAIFPNPLDSENVPFLGTAMIAGAHLTLVSGLPDTLRPTMGVLLRALQQSRAGIVYDLVSLALVPWAVGRLIGPLLITVALALVALLVPQASVLNIVRTVPYFNRVKNIVDGIVDAPRLVDGVTALPEVPGAFPRPRASEVDVPQATTRRSTDGARLTETRTLPAQVPHVRHETPRPRGVVRHSAAGMPEATQSVARGRPTDPERATSGSAGAAEASGHSQRPTNVTDVRRRLVAEFSQADRPPAHIRLAEILPALQRSSNPVARDVLRHLQLVYDALHDPELLAEVVTELWSEGEALRLARATTTPPYNAPMTSAAIRAASRIGRRPVVVRQAMDPDPFYANVVGSGRYFVDPGIGSFHGPISHLIQDLAVDRAFKRAGSQMTVSTFRQALLRLDESVPELGHRPLGQVVWEQTWDTAHLEQLAAPENLRGLINSVIPNFDVPPSRR